MAREDTEDAIIAYKSILAQIIDNRPSGTRQRLATELGKHRSFVTQITSPTYATPLPARHLATPSATIRPMAAGSMRPMARRDSLVNASPACQPMTM